MDGASSSAPASDRRASGQPPPRPLTGRRCLLVLAGWLLASAALESRFRAGLPAPEPRALLAPGPPDLARASPRELRRLPGVGPLLALEMERTRWELGSLADLEQVHGIGPRGARSILTWLETRGAELQGPPRERAPPGE